MKKKLPSALLILLLLASTGSIAQAVQDSNPQKSGAGRVQIQLLVFTTKDNDAVRSMFGGVGKSIWRTKEFLILLRALAQRTDTRLKIYRSHAIIALGQEYMLPTGVASRPVIPNIGVTGILDANNYLEASVNLTDAGRDFLYKTDVNLVIPSNNAAGYGFPAMRFTDTLYTVLGETVLIGKSSGRHSQTKHRLIFAAVTISPIDTP